ncbi:MAG TPA: serine/threonine-protein kinase, partial [Gemmataceae bacterium]
MEVGQRIGPFEIERELGSGAMGTVYRARVTDTGQVVALKVIAFGLAGNESARKRFEREAAILKQLRHRHIVRLVATGQWRKTPFFAMEYVDGESLDRAQARRGRFSWEEVVRIGIQLCDALQHAHERGIIHRDIKP